MFFDWVETLSLLEPSDAWKVVVALKEYHVRGTNPVDNVEPNLKALVHNMFQEIKRSETKAENGRKGALATNSKRNFADGTPTAHRRQSVSALTAERREDGGTEAEAEAKTSISPPIPPSRGDGDGQSAISALIDGAALSDTVKAKLREWLAYKGKSAYKLASVKALVSRTRERVKENGDAAVCDLIDDCMANGYKGIIWEKLDRMKGGTSASEIVINSSDKLLKERLGF